MCFLWASHQESGNHNSQCWQVEKLPLPVWNSTTCGYSSDREDGFEFNNMLRTLGRNSRHFTHELLKSHVISNMIHLVLYCTYRTVLYTVVCRNAGRCAWRVHNTHNRQRGGGRIVRWVTGKASRSKKVCGSKLNHVCKASVPTSSPLSKSWSKLNTITVQYSAVLQYEYSSSPTVGEV